jgi:serine/threonine protein phosphatase PrpC
VGGYLGGKKAGQIAVDIIRDKTLILNSEEALSSCLSEINEAILKEARNLGYEGMGTTLALAKIVPEDKKILTANVGDSPIFLVSKEDIVPVYKDDSMRFKDPTNLWSIIQYLGIDQEEPKVHTMTTNYSEGNILLLCSDGVSDNILGIENNLSKLRNAVNDTRNARQLVSEAMGIGLKADDMSAILIFL